MSEAKNSEDDNVLCLDDGEDNTGVVSAQREDDVIDDGVSRSLVWRFMEKVFSTDGATTNTVKCKLCTQSFRFDQRTGSKQP